MHGIKKAFAGVYALKGANFSLRKGEVMALVGENGAGKSTLMRILTGIYQPDDGEILYKESRRRFKNAKESSAAGIAMIHQEFNLFPNLTAAENIFIDNPSVRRCGLVSWKVLNRKAQELVDLIGGGFKITEKASALTVQNQQVVEIVKAFSLNAEIIIMDEPTSALPENEVQKLFKTIRELQKQGVSIIYVSHRLNEIFEICQRITVLSDGMTAAVVEVAKTTQAEVISHMIGKELNELYPKMPTQIGEIALEVNGLSDGKVVKDARFSARKGEIIGLYGLVGSGATECPELIFGLKKAVAGSIDVDGKTVAIRSAKDALRHGIAYVPPDRHRQGIIRQLGVGFNLSLAIIKRLCKGKTLIDRPREKNLVAEYIEKLGIRCVSQQQSIKFLSGGNQQKVVISKWLAVKPKILILNDPTRGVDVGSKAEIYALISDLACQGITIILTSNDILEILGMADRVVVFNSGVVSCELPREQASQAVLLHAAMSVPA